MSLSCDPGGIPMSSATDHHGNGDAIVDERRRSLWNADTPARAGAATMPAPVDTSPAEEESPP
jgi:hypothetical protein